MVAVDTSESKPEAGAGGVEAGEYHWMIEEVDVQHNDGRTSLKVVSSVLAGTTAGQVGRKQTEFFQLEGKAVDRLRRLLVSTGIMSDEQWVANIGRPLEFDEMLLKGRQFCSRIKLEPYRGSKPEHQGKNFPAMNFDIWSVWDKKAAHIPKDPECMALLGDPPAGAGQGPQASGNGPQQAPQQAPQQSGQAAAQTAAEPQNQFSW